MNTFFMFIGAIIAVFGVILIYDARIVAEKYFSISDINKAVNILKVVGVVLIVIAWFILYYNYT